MNGKRQLKERESDFQRHFKLNCGREYLNIELSFQSNQTILFRKRSEIY